MQGKAVTTRRDGHSALHWDKDKQEMKTSDPHPQTTPSPDFKPVSINIKGDTDKGWDWVVTWRNDSVVMGHEKTFAEAHNKINKCLKGERE